MKYIELTQGQQARISDEDYDELNRYKWYAHWNAHSNTYYVNSRINGKYVAMHRFILVAQHGQLVDHIDHNGLHNERQNIRLCSISENCGNARKRTDGLTSRYKGVSWNNQERKWHVAIKIKGITRYLGCFTNEGDAARTYDRAAREQWKDFALTNMDSF